MQSLFSKLILLAKNPLHNFISPAILYLEFAGELLQLRMTWSKPFEPDGAKTLEGSKMRAYEKDDFLFGFEVSS